MSTDNNTLTFRSEMYDTDFTVTHVLSGVSVAVGESSVTIPMDILTALIGEFLRAGAVVKSEQALRLEELRTILRDESLSYGELAELEHLASFIDEGDVELLEAAGVPEFPKDDAPSAWGHADLGDWRYEVTNGDTLRSFAEWLEARAEQVGYEKAQFIEHNPDATEDEIADFILSISV